MVGKPVAYPCPEVFWTVLAAGKDLYSEETMTWSIPEAEQCLAAATPRPRGADRATVGKLETHWHKRGKWVKDGMVGKVTTCNRG